MPNVRSCASAWSENRKANGPIYSEHRHAGGRGSPAVENGEARLARREPACTEPNSRCEPQCETAEDECDEIASSCIADYAALETFGVVVAAAATSSDGWERGGGAALAMTAVPLVGLLMARRWAWILSVALAALAAIFTLADGHLRVWWMVFDLVVMAVPIYPILQARARRRQRSTS